MITAIPESVGLSSERLNRINDVTSGYINRSDLAGTVSLVMRRGEVVHFQCSGKMSLETGVPMQEDSIFRIYSMTKPITSVAIMILYERGYFQLDTPVSKFIPEFKHMEVFESGTVDDYKTVKPQREMTIGDLLKHTSGITYEFLNRTVVGQIYQKENVSINFENQNLEAFVHEIARMPLLFSPGTKWNYGMSTDVLGYIIEVISGKTLDVFFMEEIFEPLGMVDTDFFVPESKRDRLTTKYLPRIFAPEEVRLKYPDQKLFIYEDHRNKMLAKSKNLLKGGQGLFSTASDYLQFTKMLLNKGRAGKNYILSPKTVSLMTTNHLPGDLQSCCVHNIGRITPAGAGFGLGFTVMVNPTLDNRIGTPGEYHWNGGAHTSFFVDPKEDMIAILLTQVFPAGVYNIEREFNTAVYQSIIE
jgi:CubicO group peptidase (beta-lactamase class C family)